MKNIQIIVTHHPDTAELANVTESARMTQVRGYIPQEGVQLDERLLRKLIELGHTSCLEHADFGVIVVGASRVFLAQITRHRMASYTSASQQYQKHHGFDYLGLPFYEENADLEMEYHEFMKKADELYTKIEAAMGRDWARYVLPGATRNNLRIKANLREWFCTIIPQRACRRNTPETQYVMSKILQAMVDGKGGLIPFIAASGPACLTKGKCDQGTMCCGRPMNSWQDMLHIEGVD